MKSQRSPYLLRSSSSSGTSNFSSPASNSSSYASIEEGRGTPFGRPSFLQPPPLPASPEAPPPSPDASTSDGSPLAFEQLPASLQQYQVPLEIRRRIPGSGINHHDVFDSPIRCEVPPVEPRAVTFDHSNVEDLFDQFDKDLSLGGILGRKKFVQEHFQKKQYGRKQQPQPQQRPSVFSSLHGTTSGSGAGLFSSPLSSSSSSSSDSSSFDYFHPRASSTLVTTPPRLASSTSPYVPPPPPSKHFQPTILGEQLTPVISGGQELSFSPERNSAGEINYLPESPIAGLVPGLGSFPTQ